MIRLYRKSPLGFAIFWIVLYCLLQSLANSLNEWIGIDYSASCIVCAVQVIVLLRFLSKHKLNEYYGLCRSAVPARQFLYYIPLIVIASGNLWGGIGMNYSLAAAVLRVLTMIGVGLLEEIIFRGLLFRALLKDGVTIAVIIASVTFGVGHFINLVNGSGASLLENICQVIYACAFGFLCVIVFYRSGSLIPCILTHSAVNSLSTFQNQTNMNDWTIMYALVMAAIMLGYAIYINSREKNEVFPSAEASQGITNKSQESEAQ